MELTYENIKSIILGILIVTSLLLTWNLWTYQPSYEELQNTKVVQEVSLSPAKEVKEVVRPSQVVFHINNQYYGTTHDLEVEKVINQLRGWSFWKFDNISMDVDNISSLINRNDMVKILYPDRISMDIFKNILTMKNKDVPNFQFDQIVINTDVQNKENGVIYFVSQEDNRIYRSSVPASSLSEFKQKYGGSAMQPYVQYVPYQFATGKTIYLPEEETELDSYQYLYKEIDSDDMKNALFSDPSLVQKNYISTGEEYTDGESLMQENLDSSMIYYVNPAGSDEMDDDSDDLLKKSIDFVNDHGGFTDHYRFTSIDSERREVHFRLYDTSGHPIFGQSKPISDISLVWGETDISRYVRNNFYFGLLTQTNKVKLSPGPDIVNGLIVKGYDLDHVEDIVIGYQMEKDAQEVFINLEPCWYFLYDGVWQSFISEGTGGDSSGLE